MTYGSCLLLHLFTELIPLLPSTSSSLMTRLILKSVFIVNKYIYSIFIVYVVADFLFSKLPSDTVYRCYLKENLKTHAF
jgi:hypothetical protein